MPSQALFNVPYAYETSLVRRRHRIAERIWLRSSMHVQILELDGREAPVRLMATLEQGRHDSKRIALRHDGKSYLRPAVLYPASGRKPATCFTRANLEKMLTLLGSEPTFRFDAPKAWLTRDNSRFTVLKFGSPAGPPALEIKTVDDVAGDVREWLSSADDAARAQRAAVAEADEYVLVDGILHRRTAAPMLAWINFRSTHDKEPGTEKPPHHPELLDAAEFAEFTVDKNAEGAWWNWWPVSAAPGFIAMVQGTWKLKVEAPLETDHGADLVRVGRTVMPRVDHYLSGAVEHLSDAGLDHFRTYRANRARGLAGSGDATALVAAMEAARELARDPGFVSGERSVKIVSDVVNSELPHWDELLRSFGLGMGRRDEEAMLALGALLNP